jgi:hypothetical protein
MIPLRPKITTTTTQRDYLDDNPPINETLKETHYDLVDDDQVHLGLSSVSVRRGNRFNDGEEHELRIANYSQDIIGKAIVCLVLEMKRQAEDNSSEFCQARATSFLSDLRSALA